MSAGISEKLKEKWLSLKPPARAAIAIGLLLVVLFLISKFFIRPGEAPVRVRNAPTASNSLLLPKPKDVTNEQLVGMVNRLQSDIGTMKDKTESMQKSFASAMEAKDKELAASKTSSASADLTKEVMDLRSEVAALKAKEDKPTPSAKGKSPDLDAPLQLPSADSTGEKQAAEPAAPRIRVTGTPSAQIKEPAKAAAKPNPYLPATSFFEAMLMNGMDAPTSSAAQKNPTPAMLRIKTEAILPNKYRYDIRECFALVSGYGVLSSERAQLRTETLSCVTEGGKVLESRVDGYIVGEDGRVGMRGRLVSKQGQLIAKSLAAGVLSGFSQALTPTAIPRLEIGGGSGSIQTQTAGLDTIAETGVAKGFSTAANSASKFFLDMAKEMTPVVEIDAGRKVTIVLTKGVELK